MPGIDVRAELIQGPTSPDLAPASTAFFAGITERGPTAVASLVRSLDEFRAVYGTRQSYGTIDDAVTTYFNEGGDKAYIGRAVGAGAVLATLTLLDRAGAPVATLRVDAKNAGSWGNALTAQVADGTGTSVTITISGTPDGIDEVYANVGPAPADIVTAMATSRWVNVTNLASATAAPNNRPAVLAATALATGVDDRASVTAATEIAVANTLFTSDLGAGAVAIPGQAAATIAADLIAHCRTTHRLAILATAAGQTPSQAKATAAALIGALGDFGGLFYPWVRIPAGGATTRLISPEGYVCAKRSLAHNRIGPWRAPAGKISEAQFVVGLEREIDRATGDDLNANGVNAIRTIQRTTRLYGYRSLSNDPANWLFLTYRDLINDLEVAGAALLEDDDFDNIDGGGRLASTVGAALVGLAQPIADAGGLFPGRDPVSGETRDPGYSVDVGPSLNSLASMSLGNLSARLAVRPSPVGELITLIIAKAALNAPL